MLGSCDLSDSVTRWSLSRIRDGLMTIATGFTTDPKGAKCLGRAGSDLQLMACNRNKDEQIWERAILPNFDQSWEYNFGRFRTYTGANGNQNDASCLTSENGKLVIKSCATQWNEGEGAVSQPIEAQNWRVFGSHGVSGNNLGPYDQFLVTSIPNMPASKFDYRNGKVRGVGLGGWLVLEPFITPNIFYTVSNDAGFAHDEWSLCEQYRNKQINPADVLNKHWSTFYTELDFYLFQYYKLNHVRLPIGWWAIPNIGLSGTPYVSNSWDYVIKAVGWCRKYGLKMILDIHSAPGEQNPWNHAGREKQGGWGSENFLSKTSWVQQLLRGLETIGDFAGQNDDVITMVDILNEPFYKTDQPAGLKLNWFYSEAYKRIRYDRNKNARGIWVQFDQAFREWKIGNNYWENRFGESANYVRTSLDIHIYQVFDPNIRTQDIIPRCKEACNNRRHLEAMKNKPGGLLPIVGEFSGALTWCDAPYLSTFPQGFKASEDDWPAPGGCFGWKDMQSNDGDSTDLATAKATNKFWTAVFLLSQVSSFEGGGGWIYWVGKTQWSRSWDFEWASINSLFPTNFNTNYCASL
ncbi:glycoside hydrolase superfamily [Cladochytrium replicatum]|nr:glycoside hydrolase superfamily [Cladochytrium replicatum]